MDKSSPLKENKKEREVNSREIKEIKNNKDEIKNNKEIKEPKKIFHAKTSEAFVFKIITDFLKMCLKTDVKIRINRDGMFLRQANDQNTILTEVSLYRKEFDKIYEYNDEKDLDLFIEIDLSELQKILKHNKKKKDLLELFINQDEKFKMHINIYVGSPNSPPSEFAISICEKERVIEEQLTQYSYPKIIDSSDFQITLKQLTNFTTNKLSIKIQGSNYIKFFINSKEIVLGERGYGTFDETKDYFEEEFYTIDLKKIIKMASLSNSIKIYEPLVKDYPIKIETRAGNLGEVAVYIKSVSLIEKTSR